VERLTRPIAAVVFAAKELTPPASNGKRVQELVELLQYAQSENALPIEVLDELDYAVASVRSKPSLLDLEDEAFLRDYHQTKEAKELIRTLKELQKKQKPQASIGTKGAR